MESQDTQDCLETWFFMSRSGLSVDTRMSSLGSVLSFRVLSCLMSHDCLGCVPWA